LSTGHGSLLQVQSRRVSEAVVDPIYLDLLGSSRLAGSADALLCGVVVEFSGPESWRDQNTNMSLIWKEMVFIYPMSQGLVPTHRNVPIQNYSILYDYVQRKPIVFLSYYLFPQEFFFCFYHWYGYQLKKIKSDL
jgi:hypothetical protein